MININRNKIICDSDAVGIVFVVSFNLALTLGGSYGRGIVMKRLSNGVWSLPFAIEEIEASVGWQLGVSRSKTFYCLKSDQEFENFINRKNVKIGGKGYAAIGSYGLELGGDLKQSKKSGNSNKNKNQNNVNNNANTNNNETKQDMPAQDTPAQPAAAAKDAEAAMYEQEGQPSGPTPDNTAPAAYNPNAANNTNINNNNNGGATAAAVDEKKDDASNVKQNNNNNNNTFGNESIDGRVGNAQGLALGANVNVGTFQLCNGINKKFYKNFDARRLIDVNSYTGNQSQNVDSKGNAYNVPAKDISDFLNTYHNLIKIMERLIAVDSGKKRENNQFMDDFFWCAEASTAFN